MRKLRVTMSVFLSILMLQQAVKAQEMDYYRGNEHPKSTLNAEKLKESSPSIFLNLIIMPVIHSKGNGGGMQASKRERLIGQASIFRQHPRVSENEGDDPSNGLLPPARCQPGLIFDQMSECTKKMPPAVRPSGRIKSRNMRVVTRVPEGEQYMASD